MTGLMQFHSHLDQMEWQLVERYFIGSLLSVPIYKSLNYEHLHTFLFFLIPGL